jgi:4-hydroxythreonine-4-phosphate dehydrogenase
MKAKVRRFLLTTGDADGVGLEVTYKALLKTALPVDTEIVVLEPERVHHSLQSIRKKVAQKRGVLLLPSSDSPAHWVYNGAKACLRNEFSGLITAPLSKTLIRDAGFKYIGHTEILAAVSRRHDLHMAFIGREFNVVLATGHAPIKRVGALLSTKNIVSTVEQADRLRRRLPTKLRKRPLALLGLNPHAGEKNLIGNEESRAFKAALRALQRKKIKVVGPLVPDAAFLRQNWQQYSVFICAYHDQGLIPFKLVHGADSGAHITLGLPFVRTSVDHGTAKDIFGQGRANPNSMCDAIRWAIKLAE